MKKRISPQKVCAHLEEYNIFIRAIPGEVWTLSVDKPLNRNTPNRVYRLTETASKRTNVYGAEPRVYTGSDLCSVLLSFLFDPDLKQENRQAQKETRYPIPQNSNIIKLDSQRKRGNQ